MSSLGVKTPATCRASFDHRNPFSHRLMMNWLCYSACTMWGILQHEEVLQGELCS